MCGQEGDTELVRMQEISSVYELRRGMSVYAAQHLMRRLDGCLFRC